MEVRKNKILMIPAALIVVILAVWLVGSMIVSIPAGYIGIETKLERVTGKIYTEGTSLKAPFITKVVRMSTRIQDFTEIQTQGELTGQEVVYLTCQTKYKIDSSRAIDIYREAGINYIDYLAPRQEVIDVIKSVIATYSIDNFAVSRDKVAADVLEKLAGRFAERGIIFTSFSIANYNFDESLEEAISQKNLAAQTQRTQQIQIQTEKERASADKELAKIEAEKQAETKKIEAEAAAERKKIAAQAEAEAIRIEAEAQAEATALKAKAEAQANKDIAASVTRELIEYNEVNRWNGSRATIVGSGAVITDITGGADGNTAGGNGAAGDSTSSQ